MKSGLVHAVESQILDFNNMLDQLQLQKAQVTLSLI